MPLVKFVETLPNPEDGPGRERHDSFVVPEGDSEVEKILGTGTDSLEPHASFVGKHRWDPHATWTDEEERAVLWKTDMHLLVFFCVISIGLAIDRHNLSNALTDNFLEDLGLNTNDFNYGHMVSILAILLSEFPTQMLILKYRFRNVFPWLIMAWGTVSWTQAFIKGRAGFYVTRALIGALEGGFWPGAVLFLSEFYTARELAPRLAICSAMVDVSLALASLLAAGILKMRGVLDRPGWFWLFLLEGIVVFIIGIISLFYLPLHPTRTKSVLWRDSWYTPDEEIILVNRVLRDDYSKGQEAQERPTIKEILRYWKDTAFWGFFLVSIMGPIPKAPLRQYLHLTLRRLGFSKFRSNVLAIPAAAMQIFTILGITFSSKRFNERTWHCVFAMFCAVPMLSALEAFPAGGKQWERYSCAILIAGSPNFGPIMTGWISESAFSVKKRGVLLATHSVLALLGVLISTQIYRKDDEPYYYTGNKVTITLAVATCFVFIGQRYCLKYLNGKKDRKWQAMSMREQLAYQNDKARKDEGNGRLDFRFQY